MRSDSLQCRRIRQTFFKTELDIADEETRDLHAPTRGANLDGYGLAIRCAGDFSNKALAVGIR